MTTMTTMTTKDYELLFWKHFHMDIDEFEALVRDLEGLSGIDALMDAFWAYRGMMEA